MCKDGMECTNATTREISEVIMIIHSVTPCVRLATCAYVKMIIDEKLLK